MLGLVIAVLSRDLSHSGLAFWFPGYRISVSFCSVILWRCRMGIPFREDNIPGQCRPRKGNPRRKLALHPRGKGLRTLNLQISTLSTLPSGQYAEYSGSFAPETTIPMAKTSSLQSHSNQFVQEISEGPVKPPKTSPYRAPGVTIFTESNGQQATSRRTSFGLFSTGTSGDMRPIPSHKCEFVRDS